MNWKKKNKYKAVKSKDPETGKVFDSKKEHRRATQLKLLERAGEISNLQEQVRYELLSTFKDNQGSTERSIVYVSDFSYIKEGQQIVEDVKSAFTKKLPVYIIKRKLFKTRYSDYIFVES